MNEPEVQATEPERYEDRPLVPRAVTIALAAFVAIVALLVAIGSSGCTPGARATAGGVVSSVAPFVPMICKVIPSLAGSEACAATTAAIDDAAQLVATLLTALGDRKAATPADLAPEHFVLRTAHGDAYVTLPAWQAAIVRAKVAP